MLEGCKIKKIRPLTKTEYKREMWTYAGHHIAIELDNGVVLYASRDDEGNGPGSIFGYDPNTNGTFCLAGVTV